MGRFPEPGDTFGAYVITEVIGHGGMGVVFGARQRGLDRTVALKVLAPQFARQSDYRSRFAREASALARLDSPHVIHVYDHGEIEGCLFLATQFVGGGDLGDLLARHGALSIGTAIAIAGQVADALADAHRAQIVHRDVKPSNILLRAESREPWAYLCDFGIAQAETADVTDGVSPLTAAGSVPGTVAYLAPERCRGEAATPASDLYALGCVLVAMLTGQAPYRGSDIEIGVQHLNGAVPQLPGHDTTTRRLNDLLCRLLAKDPRGRPASAADVRDDLTRIGQELSSGSSPAPPPLGPPLGPPAGRPVTPRRRRTSLWIAGAVAAVLVLGAAVGGTVVALRGADAARDTAGTAAPSDQSTSQDTPDATDDTDTDAGGQGGDRPASEAAPYAPAETAEPATGTLVTHRDFTYRVPEGWTEFSVPAVDSAWRDSTAAGFAHNVNTVTENVPASTTLNEVGISLSTTVEQLGGTDVAFEGIVAIDGVDAVYQAATLSGGDFFYRVHQFTALADETTAVTITISQQPDTPTDASQEEIGAILSTFTWQ